MLPVSSHQRSEASSSRTVVGLLAPIAPSTNLDPWMEISEKYVGAADVASAASTIVGLKLEMEEGVR